MSLYHHSFSVKSDPHNINSLRQWISEVGEKLELSGFCRKARFHISASLVEAVDNAIFHAHKGMKDNLIDISFTVDTQTAILEVADNGEGIKNFSPKLVSEYEEHGRGLYIINQLMSEVQSVFKNGKHHLVMKYNFNDKRVDNE
ncbi:MAG: ATP-binding protein [Pseudomonadota bacterium]